MRQPSPPRQHIYPTAVDNAQIWPDWQLLTALTRQRQMAGHSSFFEPPPPWVPMLGPTPPLETSTLGTPAPRVVSAPRGGPPRLPRPAAAIAPPRSMQSVSTATEEGPDGAERLWRDLCEATRGVDDHAVLDAAVRGECVTPMRQLLQWPRHDCA